MMAEKAPCLTNREWTTSTSQCHLSRAWCYQPGFVIQVCRTTHIPWRQDLCASKTRSKSFVFLWFCLMIYFISSVHQLCHLPRGKNHHSATFPPSSQETNSWAHRASSKLVCFVILFCFFYFPFKPKRDTGLHMCQQIPWIFRCFLGGIVFQLNAVKPWTLSWLSLMLFFPKLDMPFCRWKWLPLSCSMCKRTQIGSTNFSISHFLLCSNLGHLDSVCATFFSYWQSKPAMTH